MKLLTQSIRERLIRNGVLSVQFAEERRQEPDFIPVVKLFTPDGACTWLLTELDPNDEHIAFGLCDLSMGFPELGSVRISELEAVRGKLGLPIERDRFFHPDKTLSDYAEQARLAGAIKA
jgi:hypothetical protein